MLATGATHRPVELAVPPGFAVETAVDFYGERVVLLTDHTALSGQVCTCFGRLAYAGGLVPATRPAHIRILTNKRHANRPSLERAWNAFSAGFAAAIADRFLLLHGSAVLLPHDDGPGCAAAFLGPSRCGKTTLALAAAALGLAVVADDVVALEWETGRVFAVPSPLRPRSDSLRAASGYPHVGSPALTLPVAAPVLSRIILLGLAKTGVTATTEILHSLHPPHGFPPQTLLLRMLHGLRFARIARAPALPPVGTSLAPQMRLVEGLLAPEAKP